MLVQRLDHGKPAVQILALKLAETMMKNLSGNFHRQMANPDVMKAMKALGTGKKNEKDFLSRGFASMTGRGREDVDAERLKTEVQTQALVLIKVWAEGFENVRREMPLFADTYSELQRGGARFPELTEEDRITAVVPASQVVGGAHAAEPLSPFSSAAAQLHGGGHGGGFDQPPAAEARGVSPTAEM